MKTLLILPFVLLALAGCVSSRAQKDAFASLRSRVEQMLAGRCDVAPIITDREFGSSFEAHPPNSACRILVFQREFLTQSEWDREYIAGSNSLSKLMSMTTTNQNVPNWKAKEISAILGVQRLPGWSYDHIGVDVDVQCPEVASPGFEKDNAAAQRFVEEIVTLLKAYQSADRSAAVKRHPAVEDRKP